MEDKSWIADVVRRIQYEESLPKYDAGIIGGGFKLLSPYKQEGIFLYTFGRVLKYHLPKDSLFQYKEGSPIVYSLDDDKYKVNEAYPIVDSMLLSRRGIRSNDCESDSTDYRNIISSLDYWIVNNEFYIKKKPRINHRINHPESLSFFEIEELKRINESITGDRYNDPFPDYSFLPKNFYADTVGKIETLTYYVETIDLQDILANYHVVVSTHQTKPRGDYDIITTIEGSYKGSIEIDSYLWNLLHLGETFYSSELLPVGWNPHRISSIDPSVEDIYQCAARLEREIKEEFNQRYNKEDHLSLLLENHFNSIYKKVYDPLIEVFKNKSTISALEQEIKSLYYPGSHPINGVSFKDESELIRFFEDRSRPFRISSLLRK